MVNELQHLCSNDSQTLKQVNIQDNIREIILKLFSIGNECTGASLTGC